MYYPPLLASPALSMRVDGPLFPPLCAGVLSLEVDKPQRPGAHHLGLPIKPSDAQTLPSSWGFCAAWDQGTTCRSQCVFHLESYRRTIKREYHSGWQCSLVVQGISWCVRGPEFDPPAPHRAGKVECVYSPSTQEEAGASRSST